MENINKAVISRTITAKGGRSNKEVKGKILEILNKHLDEITSRAILEANTKGFATIKTEHLTLAYEKWVESNVKQVASEIIDRLKAELEKTKKEIIDYYEPKRKRAIRSI